MRAQFQIFEAEEPQPLLREIDPGAPYPVHALGPLRAATEAVRGFSQAPVAIPAQSALAVASLAVQGFADVNTLAGPRPTSVYALTIAQSGERKSTCDGMLMAALREHEREAMADHCDATSSWQNAHVLWRGLRDKILSDAKSGKGEKRAAAEADLDALGREPSAPASPDRTVSEPTLEGLTRLFAEGQPSLGLFSDEGGQFLGGHSMGADHRQKTLAALNGLWDGAPIRRTRAGDGAFTLHGRRLAIHLMAQPGVARGLLSDHMARDTGFLARFLVTEPASTIGTRVSANAIDDRAGIEAFAARLRAILCRSVPTDARTGGLDPRVMQLAPDARALLVDYADQIECLQAPGGKLATLTGTASKSAEQAARLAGVLTLWSDLDAPEVNLATMAQGIELAQFYLGEAVRLADAAQVSAETAKAEALRVWLIETWPEIAHRDGRTPSFVTPRDVIRNGPNALRESKAALATLADHGWITAVEPGTEIDGSNRRQAYRITGAR